MGNLNKNNNLAVIISDNNNKTVVLSGNNDDPDLWSDYETKSDSLILDNISVTIFEKDGRTWHLYTINNTDKLNIQLVDSEDAMSYSNKIPVNDLGNILEFESHKNIDGKHVRVTSKRMKGRNFEVKVNDKTISIHEIYSVINNKNLLSLQIIM